MTRRFRFEQIARLIARPSHQVACRTQWLSCLVRELLPTRASRKAAQRQRRPMPPTMHAPSLRRFIQQLQQPTRSTKFTHRRECRHLKFLPDLIGVSSSEYRVKHTRNSVLGTLQLRRLHLRLGNTLQRRLCGGADFDRNVTDRRNLQGRCRLASL